MLRHGSSRNEPLPADFVALNTFEVVDSMGMPRFDSASELRERFKIAPHAEILLISVKQDTYVESFWAHRDKERLSALARLNLAAVTSPNFSFFEDAPRLHSVRNFWRILRIAEELADAAVTPIIHVNALCREDWRMWSRILQGNPGVRHVCKEFQTGLSDPQRAAEAIDGLRWLQDDVGRQMHPIVVGGRRVARELAKHFASFTIVDSVPFFATINRKRIVVDGTSATQIDSPTAPGKSLDPLLQDNLRTYSKLVAVCARSNSVDVPDGFDEGEDVESFT